MKIINLTLMLTLLFLAMGAEASASSGYYKFSKGQEAYVYSLVANIRESPDTKTAVIDKLNNGNIVEIIEVTGIFFEHKKINAPWLKITYSQETYLKSAEVAEKKTGYIWSGNLSISQLRRGSLRFVYGLESLELVENIGAVNSQSYKATLGVKTLRYGEVISETQFTGHLSDGINGKVESSRGLNGVEYIITINSPGDSSQSASYSYCLAWTGSQLILLPYSSSTGNLGAQYYNSYLIFPEQGAPGNTILKVIAQGWNDSISTTTSTQGAFDHERYKVEVYKWDGKTATKHNQDWVGAE